MVVLWIVGLLCCEQGCVVCMPGSVGYAWVFLGLWWVCSFWVCTWVTKISNEVLGVAFVVGIGVGVGWRADGGGRFTWEVVNGGVLGEGL